MREEIMFKVGDIGLFKDPDNNPYWKSTYFIVTKVEKLEDLSYRRDRVAYHVKWFKNTNLAQNLCGIFYKGSYVWENSKVVLADNELAKILYAK